MRHKPITTGLPSAFFIWNRGVMFHFEKVRFDQYLQPLCRMFRIFEGGTGKWTEKREGKR